MEIPAKVCTRCKVEKPVESFHRDNKRPDGRQTRCRECIKAVQAPRRAHHAEKWLIENPYADEVGTKMCSACRETLKLVSFQKNKNAHDGLNVFCRQCANAKSERNYANNSERILARQRSTTYGISDEDYQVFLKRQEGKCAICEQEETAIHYRGKPMRFQVDHCHVTGKVRGLLCRSCNHGLGRFRDDPSALRRAAEYVEKSGADL